VVQKILVTGCAGFIGWKTCEKLLERGEEVIGIDNLNDYYDVKLKEWRLNQLKKYKNFDFCKIDISNFQKIKKVFEKNKFEAVINLAARAGVRASLENPWDYVNTNITGTLNLLELCKDFKIEKFVLASTSSIYGNAKLPFKEGKKVDKVISPYAATKKSAEVLCYTYHYLYNLDITILRYFTVYGPAGRPDMSVFRFIKLIKEDKLIEVYGDGEQKRDFTYIDDIAEGTIKALKPLGCEIINLGNNRPVKLNYIIKLIEKILAKKARINYKDFHKADLRATWADINKAKRLLGWKPKVSIEEGIKKTIDWFEENWSWVQQVKI